MDNKIKEMTERELSYYEIEILIELINRKIIEVKNIIEFMQRQDKLMLSFKVWENDLLRLENIKSKLQKESITNKL